MGLAAMAASLSATTIVFGVDTTPNHDYGTSTTFTFGTGTLGVAEFNGGSLYSKSAGADEVGMGVSNDSSGDNEIWHKATGTQDFIQLDLGDLISKGYSGFSFTFNSLSADESNHISYCSSSGTDCGNTAGGITGTNHFVDFSAPTGNYLIHSMTATSTATPEPLSLGLVGSGLIGLFLIRRRRSSSL